jgi:NAD(P)-dependent dehydrogenase (short-subunit alcohol dehydrogenase family)
MTHAGGLLAGKAAIVTGGAAGIGAAVAQRFETEGASVLVVDTTAVAGGLVADVRDPDTAPRAVEAALDRFGRIDVLVNNVGHYVSGGGHFHESDESDWAALHEVNLLHVLRVTRAVLPVMIGQGDGGSVITVSSVEAFRGAPMQPVYGAYKAAVAHFAKSLALDVAEFGIRVNDIAPDVTRSEQVPYDRWLTDDDVAKIPRWVPIGRLGEPDDIASVALFLASDLSRFVTGTSIHADGGTFAAGGWFRTTHGRRSWTNRPYDP